MYSIKIWTRGFSYRSEVRDESAKQAFIDRMTANWTSKGFTVQPPLPGMMPEEWVAFKGERRAASITITMGDDKNGKR